MRSFDRKNTRWFKLTKIWDCYRPGQSNWESPPLQHQANINQLFVGWKAVVFRNMITVGHLNQTSDRKITAQIFRRFNNDLRSKLAVWTDGQFNSALLVQHMRRNAKPGIGQWSIWMVVVATKDFVGAFCPKELSCLSASLILFVILTLLFESPGTLVFHWLNSWCRCLYWPF